MIDHDTYWFVVSGSTEELDTYPAPFWLVGTVVSMHFHAGKARAAAMACGADAVCEVHCNIQTGELLLHGIQWVSQEEE